MVLLLESEDQVPAGVSLPETLAPQEESGPPPFPLQGAKLLPPAPLSKVKFMLLPEEAPLPPQFPDIYLAVLPLTGLAQVQVPESALHVLEAVPVQFWGKFIIQ